MGQPHLRRRLRHFFKFMSKVTYLCYFSKILCYFFRNLFGSNQNLCDLKQNLFHLSHNYVIKPIIMCVCKNIHWPTSRCYSMMAKLCYFAAILRWFHQINKLRFPNIDSIIIFSAFQFFCYQLTKNNILLCRHWYLHQWLHILPVQSINQFSLDKDRFSHL